MLTVRIQAIDGTGTFTLPNSQPCRLLTSLHGHYPTSRLLWSSPRLAGASVLSASRCYHLCLFPSHHQPGSQVPYESPNESHASCTPDTTWPVSRYPPCCSRSKPATPVLMSSWFGFDASSEVHLHSSLSPILDVIKRPSRPGRGRDSDCSLPPAQTRAGATSAHGSYLGYWDVWRRTARRGRGAGSGPVATGKPGGL
jgi:hypothetical protein